MSGNTKKVGGGVSLALAVASLVACNDKQGGNSINSATNNSATDTVHCYDVNICCGHNDCKTANNSCAGHGACKGSGFVAMPVKACADAGGSIKDEWIGKVDNSDLSHCYEVNICKGHNDCKTAQNNCAGQASCKGAGFLSMPAKSCSDIGGKVGT